MIIIFIVFQNDTIENYYYFQTVDRQTSSDKRNYAHRVHTATIRTAENGSGFSSLFFAQRDKKVHTGLSVLVLTARSRSKSLRTKSLLSTIRNLCPEAAMPSAIFSRILFLKINAIFLYSS